MRPHLLGLPGGEWLVWRTAGLRGAGFPVSWPAELSAPQAAAEADRLLTAGAGASNAPPTDAAYEHALHVDLQRIRASLRRFARTPAFREAVLWQNPRAVKTGLDVLVGKPAGAEGKKVRQKEQLVARYLQRYCTKNDTIGFFGPVGWASLEEGAAALELRPGPQLIASRRVFFEGWCIDALAEALAGRPELRPWLVPRRLPYLRLEGNRLHMPQREPFDLPESYAQLLAACDGTRRAGAIVDELAGDASLGLSGEELYELLAQGCELGVVTWGFPLPMELHPEERLRGCLERIVDPDLRSSCLGGLDRLDQARSCVGAAAGNPARLEAALDELEAEFTRLTGRAAHRAAGQSYAGRTLVYEDCRRDVTLRLGRPVLDRLGPPLSLLLTSARWLTFEVARRCRRALLPFYDRLAADHGEPVELAVLQQALLQQNGEPLRSVVGEVQAAFTRRWRDLLQAGSAVRRLRLRAEELAPAVQSCFDAPGAGWTLVRHISPDILIAGDAESLRGGDFQLVLGELHVGNTLMWSLFLSQHEQPQALVAAAAADLSSEVVLPVLPRDQYPQRVNIPLLESGALAYEYSADSSGCPPDRVLQIGDLIAAREDGAVVVRSRDGRRRFDAVEFLGVYLSRLWGQRLFDLGGGGHTPRVSIDDLVVLREQWQVEPAGLDFAAARTTGERFRLARRWAVSLGLPRFVFVKVPTEPKPCYVDFDSPVYVDELAKLVRSAVEVDGAPGTVTVSEMLPRPDQTWLTDADGQRYTAELRMVVLDPRPTARRAAGG